MENTIENKIKLFSLYWGLKVVDYYDNLFKFDEDFPKHWHRESFLELRDLANITDKEAVELAKKRGYLNIKSVRIEEEGYWVKFLGVSKTVFVFFTELYGEEVDYVRSIGCAYPFNGLSIHHQLEYGWFKYKKDK